MGSLFKRSCDDVDLVGSGSSWLVALRWLGGVVLFCMGWFVLVWLCFKVSQWVVGLL